MRPRPPESPNLPGGRVRRLVIGERYRQALERPLSALGVQPVWLPDNPALPRAVTGHADLSVLYPGEGRLLLARELRGFAPELIAAAGNGDTEIIFSERPAGARYPDDCGLNVCLLPGLAILNPNTADPAVPRAVKPRRVIAVSQGYARCSVCPVDGESLITADRGIAARAREAGLDVLLISPGHIALPGYAYGFIGGSAFKLSAGELAFTGCLDGHPDAAAILDFLKRRNVSPVCLTDDPLFDIGGAVLLSEEA